MLAGGRGGPGFPYQSSNRGGFQFYSTGLYLGLVFVGWMGKLWLDSEGCFLNLAAS
jgi:hypothetical protein